MADQQAIMSMRLKHEAYEAAAAALRVASNSFHLSAGASKRAAYDVVLAAETAYIQAKAEAAAAMTTLYSDRAAQHLP